MPAPNDPSKRLPAAIEIDAAGKYVLPGLINAHAHVQDERGGIPQPLDYELKIWLAEEARVRIREYKAMGADGVKFLGVYRDVMEAAEDEAHKLGLPVAHHAGVEETNVWDAQH
jgi:cytosine/adenosine deaminase-related metal-dependent hydrolase